ncbi:MAG: CidA/LrgA family protein [Lachnospiraceae bacterium]
MKYLRQAAIILFVTCIGELLHYFLPLPIPASIYGLLLMFGLLYFHVVKLESVEAVGDLLVEIMPVMFIPAGVGLVVSWTELQAILVPVCVITAVVTLIVMVVTGKVSDALLSKKPGEVKDEVLECADKVRQQARTAMSTAADLTAVNTREA